MTVSEQDQQQSTASSAPEDSVQSIDVVAILKDSVQAMGRNFVSFSLLSLLVTLPVFLLEHNVDGREVLPEAVVLFVVALVLYQLVTGTLVYGTFRSLNKEPASIGAAIRLAFQRFLPLIGLAFLSAFLITTGMLLFIIPGIILGVMLAVAVPVIVVERTGVLDSLSRSMDLTRGNRWRVFAVLAVWFVADLALELGFDFVLPEFTGEYGLYGLYVVDAVFIAWYSVMIAVLYHHLRSANDGVDAIQLAAVFD